ncbi:FtsQ-type POTRA domain-containing protein [Microbacterium sp. 2FI]|uniref:FtsQ-type POTRA domain-containing protein n=1 Tax=Microbacterium sp. 2FI TaxID=2502193 RepID=UPI0010F605A4|nr:FtsQ-type POTRA domain-containing protein [Microbacterium sp. 2FI]
MRRPPPLPPPSNAPAAGAATVDDAPRAPADETTTDAATAPADAAETRATNGAAAPVIPITAPVGIRRPEGADPAAEPASDAPVSLRDVWRAARARRRALRAEVRRFTVRQRRRRIVWIGVGAALVVLVLATLGAAYSPLFAVRDIRVVGAEQLDAAEVEQALGDQLGTPLPLVDESAVKAALVGFPLVESYSLEARPPHELVVRIVERTPIGSVDTAAGYSLVDAAGVVLATSASPAAGVPVLSITGGTDSDAFDAAGQVMRSLPDEIAVQVTGVSASTPDDVTLTLGGTNTLVVWGSAQDSALKAVVLQRAMASRPPADVFSYDVSSPSAIVIR